MVLGVSIVLGVSTVVGSLDSAGCRDKDISSMVIQVQYHSKIFLSYSQHLNTQTYIPHHPERAWNCKGKLKNVFAMDLTPGACEIFQGIGLHVTAQGAP